MAKKVLTKPNYAVNNVQSLDNIVIDQAETLKATYDKTGKETKEYLENSLIPELQSTEGASAIGSNGVFGGDNVEDELVNAKIEIQNIVLGQLPNDSITREKIDIALKASTGVQKGTVTLGDITLTLGTLEYGQSFEFWVDEDVASATINGVALKDLEGNALDIAANTVYVGWLVDDVIDFFQLAPRGSGGGTAWLQQYDGANAVLKNSKGKDVTVKTGDYVNSVFYETVIAPIGADLTVKSLLHLDGTDGCTVFTDESGKVWTAHGNAQIDTSESKFGGASALFDGTGDWIDTPAIDDFNLGSNDFTIDFWIKRASASGVTERILGQNDNALSSASRSILSTIQTNGQIQFLIKGVSLTAQVDSTTLITDTNWHHFAFVRDGSTLRLFIDGIQDATTDVTEFVAQVSPYIFSIGRAGEYASQYFNGHIDEFRFVNGEAKWTTNFTPPTAPYDYAPTQVIPPTTKATDKLKSLIHFDGADGSTTFTDETGTVWTANGSAQLDTVEKKFGTASLLLDGVNSFLTIEKTDDFRFGINDFTIEFWAKRVGIPSSSESIFSINDGSQGEINIGVNSTTGYIRVDIRDVISQKAITGTTNICDGNFNHIAIAKRSGVVNLYINGSSEGTPFISEEVVDLNGSPTIGRLGDVSDRYFEGRVDEFEVINGTAKYTSNFTPPTAPYIYEDERDINLQAKIDGTLEMYNPEIDQVYQGFVSKELLWDSGMEGKFPYVEKFGTFNFSQTPTTTGTEELRQTTLGSGRVRYLTGERPWGLYVDGVRYPSSGFYQSLSNRCVKVNIKFDSELKIFQTTGSSTQQIVASINFDDGTYLSSGKLNSQTPNLLLEVIGSGAFHNCSLANVSVEIDGYFAIGEINKMAAYATYNLCHDFEFKNSLRIYGNSLNNANVSYETF